MSSSASLPETTFDPHAVASAPVLAIAEEKAHGMDTLPPSEGLLRAPPAEESWPGRALRPNEELSSTLPLVLVRVAANGQETALPGYYACVGKMPCAEKDYHLLVRWEQRASGQQGEQRVVLPEFIRVLEPDALLLLPPL